MRPLVAALLLACAFVSTSASAQVVGGGPVHPGGAGGISRAMADSLYCARAGGTECPTGTGLAAQVTFWTGVHLIAGDSGFTYDSATDTLTVAGDVAVNGADLTTTSTGTATLFNTNATAANILGAATGAVAIAGGSGSTGVTITGNTGDVAMTGDAAVNGADLTTTSTGTATLFNTNATAVNIGGAATGNVDVAGGSGSTGTSTEGTTGNFFTAGAVQALGGDSASTPNLSVEAGEGLFDCGTDCIAAAAGGIQSTTFQKSGVEDSVTINGSTMAAGKQVLDVASTFPAGSASGHIAVQFVATTAGSGAGGQYGMLNQLNGSYTGLTALALDTETSTLATGNADPRLATDPLSANYGNQGAFMAATGSGAVNNFGGFGFGTLGALNIGLAGYGGSAAYGAANGFRTNSTSIGTVGAVTLTKNAASTTEKHIGIEGHALGADVNVAGHFSLATGVPTYASAALVANNGATTDPIARLQDNGTDVVTWVDGGVQSTTSTIESLGGDAAATPNFSVEAGEGLYDCGTNCAALAANGADVIAGNATDATVFQKWKMDGGGHPAFAGSATTDAGTGSCHSVTVTGPAAAFQVSGVCNANQTIIVNFASTWTHSAPICVVSGADQNLTPSFDIRVSSTTSAATFFAKAALGDTIGDNVGTFNVHCAETF